MLIRRDYNTKAFIFYFREFLPGEDTRDELSIYKLNFGKFIRMLEKDYVFRDAVEILIYCNQLGESIDIGYEYF